MKRRRDAGEILISSDSDGGDKDDMDVSDDDESVDDAYDDDDGDDDDEYEDDDDDENDDDEDDDDDEDGADDSDYDEDEEEEEEEEEEDESDDDSNDDNAPRSHQQRLKKGGGNANSKTVLSGDYQKLFAEASNIIRGGDLERLNLEHCKAYLRHYSLRQTGTKKTLFDRVREHVELKACGGMAKYPRSTFTINCTGDACTGDVVVFQQRVKNYKKAHRSSKQPSFLRRIVAGRIVKESYGSEKQQHTFTVEVLWSRGRKALPLLYPLLIKGRNLYRLKTFRQRWANEEERKRVLQEKHSRGHVARKTREDRISGKRHSSSNQRRLSKRKAQVTLKREQTATNFSRVNTNACVASSSRGKAGGNNTSKETAFREGSSVVSSHRQYGNRFCGTSRSTKCVLSINAGFAGLLIGSQGRNIGAISRASGARVQICENPLNPMSRLVKIFGVSEEVEIATRMVIQSFLDRGLPPPVVTTMSSGFIGQG